MFRVDHTIIADSVALAQFNCDLGRCHGACCVVGDAGAPINENEVTVVRQAYKKLKNRLRPEAVKEVEKNGVVQYDDHGAGISCVDGNECVFVDYDENGTALCSIQKAYNEGEFGWIKPISCHLFPLRIKRIAGIDYINFVYIPRICKPGCESGKREGVYLSDSLREPLVRRYGAEWYERFNERCREIRLNNTEPAEC